MKSLKTSSPAKIHRSKNRRKGGYTLCPPGATKVKNCHKKFFIWQTFTLVFTTFRVVFLYHLYLIFILSMNYDSNDFSARNPKIIETYWNILSLASGNNYIGSIFRKFVDCKSVFLKNEIKWGSKLQHQ